MPTTSLHIGRMPSFAGTFSGFVASVRGYAGWNYGQRVTRFVQNVQSHINVQIERIDTIIDNELGHTKGNSGIWESIWSYFDPIVTVAGDGMAIVGDAISYTGVGAPIGELISDIGGGISIAQDAVNYYGFHNMTSDEWQIRLSLNIGGFCPYFGTAFDASSVVYDINDAVGSPL